MTTGPVRYTALAEAYLPDPLIRLRRLAEFTAGALPHTYRQALRRT
jgi:hypothetical protein